MLQLFHCLLIFSIPYILDRTRIECIFNCTDRKKNKIQIIDDHGGVCYDKGPINQYNIILGPFLPGKFFSKLYIHGKFTGLQIFLQQKLFPRRN